VVTATDSSAAVFLPGICCLGHVELHYVLQTPDRHDGRLPLHLLVLATYIHSKHWHSELSPNCILPSIQSWSFIAVVNSNDTHHESPGPLSAWSFWPACAFWLMCLHQSACMCSPCVESNTADTVSKGQRAACACQFKPIKVSQLMVVHVCVCRAGQGACSKAS